MDVRIDSFQSFSLSAGACQWIGKRDQQEDYCTLYPLNNEPARDGSFLAVLSDGMGGVADGEKASKHIVDSFLGGYVEESNNAALEENRLATCLLKANASLGEMKSIGAIHGDAGATFISMAISEQGLCWLSVGDSLLYLQRGNEITKINTAHTWEWELGRRVKSGKMTPEAAAAAPGPRHALFAAVCGDSLDAVEIHKMHPCRVGDRYIISSDGLEPLIRTGWENLLRQEQVRNAPPRQVCELLMSKLKEIRNPRQDNTTIIVIDILPPVVQCEGCATVSRAGHNQAQRHAMGCWESSQASLAVIADGATDNASDAQAARAAIRAMKREWDFQLAHGSTRENMAHTLTEAILGAHKSIHTEGSGKCSIAAVYLCKGRYAVANVGDSRVYMPRHDKWHQLTTDDSLVRLLQERGDISPEDARNHPERNTLTQSLGSSARITPHICTGRYNGRDSFLLCSGGLWKQLPGYLWSMSQWSTDATTPPATVLNSMADAAVRSATGAAENVSALWLHSLRSDNIPSPWYMQRQYFIPAAVGAAVLVGSLFALCTIKLLAPDKPVKKAPTETSVPKVKKPKKGNEKGKTKETAKPGETEKQPADKADEKLRQSIKEQLARLVEYASKLTAILAEIESEIGRPQLMQLRGHSDNLQEAVKQLQDKQVLGELCTEATKDCPAMKDALTAICTSPDIPVKEELLLALLGEKVSVAAADDLLDSLNKEDILSRRIKQGYDVNVRGENNETALILAVRKGKAACVLLLANAEGIDLNATDKRKATALNIAALDGKEDCVAALLFTDKAQEKARHLDTSIADHNGETPLTKAKNIKNGQKIVDMLQKHQKLLQEEQEKTKAEEKKPDKK